IVSGDGGYVIADAATGENALHTSTAPAFDSVFAKPQISRNGEFVAASSLTDGRWRVESISSGETLYTAPEEWKIRTVADDGSKALIVLEKEVPGLADECQVKLVDIAEGSSSRSIFDECLFGARFSPNGAFVFAATGGSGSAVIDTETLTLARLGGQYDSIFVDFTPDGTELVIGSISGTVYVADLEKLMAGLPIEETIKHDRTISAHDNIILALVVSPDGRMVATAPWNEPAKIWDLQTGALIDQIGDKLSEQWRYELAFHPTLPQLMVLWPGGDVRIVTFASDELADIARSRLTRVMTDGECRQYFNGPCPNRGSAKDSS
ncbi:MAG: WD40 repeat domain-containing protein, partial [Acidimicrobiia bacterium]|nr:WD40 repeat domain-containing protein [Acidimicrobiia bacterium]